MIMIGVEANIKSVASTLATPSTQSFQQYRIVLILIAQGKCFFYLEAFFKCRLRQLPVSRKNIYAYAK